MVAESLALTMLEMWVTVGLCPSGWSLPVEQYAPSPEELRFMALEQALADSQAEGKETQRQLTMVSKGSKDSSKTSKPPCKGNCQVGLNQNLAGGPKLIYYNR